MDITKKEKAFEILKEYQVY